MNYDALRIGQRDAINTITKRLKAGESKTAIVLPTRYGKSDVIRLAAYIATTDRLAGPSIAFSPSEFLREQLVQSEKLAAMIKRYELPAEVVKRYRTMYTPFEVRPFSNNEILLSATIQLATRNIDRFVEIVRDQIQATKLSVTIHIDECHETSENRARGELVERLEAAGASIVLYTATAIRSDGEMIPGFRVRDIAQENAKRYVVTDAGDGKHNRIDVFNDEKHLVELIADHTTTFRQAWSENPSPLCKLSRVEIKVRLSDLAAGEESVLLSECSPSKARQYLTKAVSHPVVIRQGVALFVQELETFKRINENAAGIIFTCSDFGRTTINNRHAKEIQAQIEQIRPDFDCRIVTMKDDEGDEKSTSALARFIGTEKRRGVGDVLLVKQMGGTGLDASRIKVLLDLSPVRTVASTIQRMMRVATPWDGIRVASVVTLADPLNDAIWTKFVTTEGGAHWTTMESEWVDGYLKPKPPEGPDLRIEVQSADIHGFDDSLGNRGNVGNFEFVNYIIERFPLLKERMTTAEIEMRLRDFEFKNSVVTMQSPPPLNDVIAEKRHLIVERVKAKAGRYDPTKSDEYGERCKMWMNRAKTAAGVFLHVDLKEIVNLQTLDIMLNFLAP